MRKPRPKSKWRRFQEIDATGWAPAMRRKRLILLREELKRIVWEIPPLEREIEVLRRRQQDLLRLISDVVNAQ